MVRRMNLSTLKWAGKLVKAQVLEHVGIFSSREFCFISVSARQQLLEDNTTQKGSECGTGTGTKYKSKQVQI